MGNAAAHYPLTLVLALNYCWQDRYVRVVRMLASDVQSGKISADAIGMADIEVRLDTRDIPHPDLVIRTSGEVRLSNFLLWQAAYSELLLDRKSTRLNSSH